MLHTVLGRFGQRDPLNDLVLDLSMANDSGTAYPREAGPLDLHSMSIFVSSDEQVFRQLIQQFKISMSTPASKDWTNCYLYLRSSPLRYYDPKGMLIENGPGAFKCMCTSPLDENTLDCEQYGSRTYLGVSLKCFCRSAGNSNWSNYVRGCLACMDRENAPTDNAHNLCYMRGDRLYYRPYTKRNCLAS